MTDEVDDHVSQFLALVFLQKMPGAGDGRVRLSLRPGNESLEDAVGTACDRVHIAECREEGLLPAVEHRPRMAVGRGRRVLGRGRYQQRELSCAGLVPIIRE